MNDELPLSRDGDGAAVRAPRVDVVDVGVESGTAELERRLVEASVRGALPRSIDEDGARRLVAAMRSLGETRKSLRAGVIGRDALEAERARVEDICQELAGLGCDALFFSPVGAIGRGLP